MKKSTVTGNLNFDVLMKLTVLLSPYSMHYSKTSSFGSNLQVYKVCVHKNGTLVFEKLYDSLTILITC